MSLDQYFHAVKGLPFKYGHQDCVRFALRYYDRHHGKDFISRLPDYDSRMGGLRFLAGIGKTFSQYIDGLVTEQGFEATWERKSLNLVMSNDEAVCAEGPQLGIRMDEEHVAYRQDRGILIVNKDHFIPIEWSL